MALKSSTKLLALINTDNSLNIQAADITFDAPQAASGTGGRNTTVVIKARAESKLWEGQQTVSYTRKDIATKLTQLNVSEAHANWDSNAKVTAKVNTLLAVAEGEGFAEADLTISSQPDGSDATILNVTVAVKATDLEYIGTVIFKVTEPKRNLAEAVTTTDLNGFSAA